MNSSWTKRRVAVVGAGRSGLAATELLLQLGAHVTLTDSRSADDLAGNFAKVVDRGAKLALGDHPAELWEQVDAVVASPGIPPQAPPLVAARAQQLPVISEIELAAELAAAPCVAITGSNGKSTVTAMVGAILRTAGLEAPVCGNIGLPWSHVVAAALRGDIAPQRYVLELSSFQTEAIEVFHPHWSAILNISADHLDRHLDLDTYASAKLRICINCTDADWLVYGGDDAYLVDHLPPGPRPVPFAASAAESGPMAWLENETIYWRDPDGQRHAVMNTGELRVIGRHNRLNAAAAIALACLAGADTTDAAAALREFGGLPHRMELCGTVNGVGCINDSKATNVGATVAALRGIDEPIWLILGGRDKDSDFSALLPYLESNVRGVLLVGEATERIASSLRGHVALDECGTLDAAVDTGLESAAPGDVLLLAPACTSFDQYADFEQRGRHFRALIAAHAATD